MPFSDLNDDIHFTIQGYLGRSSLFSLSSLSRRLRYIALPRLWGTLKLVLDEEEEECLREIDGMEWMVKGRTEESVGFSLKHVKEVRFTWHGVYDCLQISSPGKKISAKEGTIRQQMSRFFELLIEILTKAKSIESLFFDGQFLDEMHSHFVLGLYSKLWPPMAALPKLRHLQLPKFFRIGTCVDSSKGWGQDVPLSSTLTHLDYGKGCLDADFHENVYKSDLQVIKHLPNLESLRISKIRYEAGLGFSEWCTDQFLGSIRQLEFDGEMPADWEDFLLRLGDYRSQGKPLRLKTLVFDEIFFGPQEDSYSRSWNSHAYDPAPTLEAFACDELRELHIGLPSGHHDLEGMLSVISNSFPGLERLMIKGGYKNWHRHSRGRAENISVGPMLTSFRHLRALHLSTLKPVSRAMEADKVYDIMVATTVIAMEYGLNTAFVSCPTLTKVRIGDDHWLLREEAEQRTSDSSSEDIKEAQISWWKTPWSEKIPIPDDPPEDEGGPKVALTHFFIPTLPFYIGNLELWDDDVLEFHL